MDHCVDRLGSLPQAGSDGFVVVNPCRALAGLPAGSNARRAMAETKIYKTFYNTNYAASWFLVRSQVLLDDSGNLVSRDGGCPASLDSRSSTLGPLSQARTDTASAPSSIIPLLGCGAAGAPLAQDIGPVAAGASTARSYTAGPVLADTMQPPAFAAGTPSTGPGGWLPTWTNRVLQDYRNFAPLHRRTCNLLFADGSVRAVEDINNDGVLNNGFVPSELSRFRDAMMEIGADEVYSQWSLHASQ
jgi:prepilin-type processing-associated H-X9-DG protein